MNVIPIKLDTKRNDKGMWSSKCPFCEWDSIGFLHGYCESQLVEHMNDEHYEGRVGNA